MIMYIHVYIYIYIYIYNVGVVLSHYYSNQYYMIIHLSHSEGWIIWLEILIELKVVNPSCSSLSSCRS